MKKLLLILFFATSAFASEPYDRAKHFGGWVDLDQNGVDTREELLLQTNDGLYLCPYTGKLLTIAEVEVDHVIPLKYAYTHGASEWTKQERVNFANDRDFLLLVKSSTNSSKQDKDFTTYLPPNLAFAMQYISLWERGCIKYNLSCDLVALNETAAKFIQYRNGINPSKK